MSVGSSPSFNLFRIEKLLNNLIRVEPHKPFFADNKSGDRRDSQGTGPLPVSIDRFSESSPLKSLLRLVLWKTDRPGKANDFVNLADVLSLEIIGMDASACRNTGSPFI